MYEPPKRRRLTKAERETVYAMCGGRCAYCGAQIELKDMQVDHVVPMEFCDVYQAIGVGLDSLDSMDNYLPACRSCNHYKSTFTIEKFRKAIERYPTVLERDSATYRNAVRFGMIEPKKKKVRFYFEQIDVEVPSLEWR